MAKTLVDLWGEGMTVYVVEAQTALIVVEQVPSWWGFRPATALPAGALPLKGDPGD